MKILGFFLLIVGGLGFLAAYGFFVLRALKEDRLLGLRMLVPGYGQKLQLRYMMDNWEDAKLPSLAQVIGGLMIVGGGSLAGVGSSDSDYYYDESYYDEDYYDEYYEEEGEGDGEAIVSSPGQSPAASSGSAPPPSAPPASTPPPVSTVDPLELERPDLPPPASIPVASTPRPTTPRSAPPPPPPPRPTTRRPPPPTAAEEDKAGDLSRIDRLIGKLVVVVKTNGTTIRGRLKDVDDEKIVIERRLGGGRMAFSVPRSDIRSVSKD